MSHDGRNRSSVTTPNLTTDRSTLLSPQRVTGKPSSSCPPTRDGGVAGTPHSAGLDLHGVLLDWPHSGLTADPTWRGRLDRHTAPVGFHTAPIGPHGGLIGPHTAPVGPHGGLIGPHTAAGLTATRRRLDLTQRPVGPHTAPCWTPRRLDQTPHGACWTPQLPDRTHTASCWTAK